MAVTAPVSFEEFKKDFTESNGLYIPNNPGRNEYRHFGVKKGGMLYLSHTELLYLYSKEAPKAADVHTKAYFDLKNSDLNVLAGADVAEQHVYVKTKHFKREEAVPIGRLVLKGRDELIELAEQPTIVAVVGSEAHCFVKLVSVGKLDFTNNKNMYK